MEKTHKNDATRAPQDPFVAMRQSAGKTVYIKAKISKNERRRPQVGDVVFLEQWPGADTIFIYRITKVTIEEPAVEMDFVKTEKSHVKAFDNSRKIAKRVWSVSRKGIWFYEGDERLKAKKSNHANSRTSIIDGLKHELKTRETQLAEIKADPRFGSTDYDLVQWNIDYTKKEIEKYHARTLNDMATAELTSWKGDPDFLKGKTQVWYSNDADFTNSVLDYERGKSSKKPKLLLRLLN